ncbi:hypothetical protein [Paludibacterium sp.]|uniref:hypothetical protein n=1 Tax=Paludibacterium sp. TaxID=1917523 RepID=UPI0025F15C45|nr:hypothetical protein [Paludibacterium sp.]MBV8647937.1 hypothetical protein [Paludibacterium sp.]
MAGNFTTQSNRSRKTPELSHRRNDHSGVCTVLTIREIDIRLDCVTSRVVTRGCGEITAYVSAEYGPSLYIKAIKIFQCNYSAPSATGLGRVRQKSIGSSPEQAGFSVAFLLQGS